MDRSGRSDASLSEAVRLRSMTNSANECSGGSDSRAAATLPAAASANRQSFRLPLIDNHGRGRFAKHASGRAQISCRAACSPPASRAASSSAWSRPSRWPDSSFQGLDFLVVSLEFLFCSPPQLSSDSAGIVPRIAATALPIAAPTPRFALPIPPPAPRGRHSCRLGPAGPAQPLRQDAQAQIGAGEDPQGQNVIGSINTERSIR